MAKSEFKVPFDKNGNMLGFQHDYGIEEWKDNFEFQDEIQFSCFSRGQSSAKAIFNSNLNKKKYFVFLADLGDMLKHGVEENGIIKGIFTFSKRGQNYGIKLLK